MTSLAWTGLSPDHLHFDAEIAAIRALLTQVAPANGAIRALGPHDSLLKAARAISEDHNRLLTQRITAAEYQNEPRQEYALRHLYNALARIIAIQRALDEVLSITTLVHAQMVAQPLPGQEQSSTEQE